MKYIEVKLTEDQARALYNLLQENLHVQPYKGEEFLARIQNKLKIELRKQLQS